jgi:hypothetical protein
MKRLCSDWNSRISAGPPPVANLTLALLIEGRLQNESGVIHTMTETIRQLPSLTSPVKSHDYH